MEGLMVEQVRIERDGPVATVIIDRPQARNAVDPPTAAALATAFLELDADDAVHATVLWGAGGTFCAGADLRAVAAGWDQTRLRPPTGEASDPYGPMGPTRLDITKPVIAAVAGHAVAGGLELALWCDLRVVEEDAVFGVYCRRWGVPLIDGGTVRLPRLIGESRALDLVLTGRSVHADEALAIGLANRVVPRGQARAAAERLAQELSALPQRCLRADRLGVRRQWGGATADALREEFAGGLRVLASGESAAGAGRFVGGAGRGGKPS
ncbi:MAG TPA: crotonase/enoyl-CoA hydratase family protein [Steroidobacteraceae bacterium]|nr:crotonase/enoyl-CoA hydratase family protein [Steroidobacteraceae bacterium]